ncbi:hypothetical protein A1O3_01714 [Capronia epimyces CBS 606.96]|uniref:M protein repeat protein n=1 Tax=Capronia epimyces CBS 606.96 TaxID=1182542 RepID=W9YJS5_9EURO|nr:uncharacterized protein A1O3_01714 [Capronia epimyces CBS 606.96]EXJ93157.1 hypothetical protein A1O3_01714 [Capronia epimyces CBS 606.96]
MDKHSSSRSGAADEAKIRPPHASTKPLTKPTAPRLSTSTRPTIASSAAKSIGGGSLSKPPARPTSATTTVRRPPSATATATPTTAAHRPRPSVTSVTSVDERPSSDEKSKAGISARPKRASLAPSTSADRTSTLRSVAATPARRTTIAPSTSTRQSIASPTGARKVPSTPGISRTTSTSTVAPRSRPLTSSISRNVGAVAQAEKKRLSTIPASPAVKTDGEEPEENKENAAAHGEEDEEQKAPVRPSLGSRQSTRSVLIEQKIREFELVNTMLQAAMTADGADGEEKESINQEASSIIAKLKSDLVKVREFERDNGRLPTEAELDEAESVKEDSESKSPVEEDRGLGASADGSVVTELQNELTQSKAYAEALQRELIDLKTKVEESNRSAEEEGRRVQEATETVRAEHVAKIEELTSLHADRVQELEASHQKTLQELRDSQQSGAQSLEETISQHLAVKESEVAKLRSELDEVRNAAAVSSSSKEAEVEKLMAELEALRIATAKDQAAKEAEIETLKLNLESKKIESETASQAAPSPSSSPAPAPAHAQELADAQQKLEAAKARHLAAKDNAKSKIARLQEEFDHKVTALEEQHKEQMGQVQDRLGQTENEVSKKQKELAQQQEEYAKISDEMARQSQVIQVLKSQVLDFQQASKVESDAQTALITQLQEELQGLGQEKADQAAAAAAALAAAEKAYAEKIQEIENRLNRAQEELKQAEALHENKLQEALQNSADNLKAAKVELESSTASHADRVQAIEAELQKANESVIGKQAEHEQALSALQNQLDAARLALDEAVKKHEAVLKEHESTRTAAEVRTAELKSAHEKEVDQLRAEYQTKQEEEIAALKESHIQQIQQLEQKIHSSEKEVAAAKENHATQIKQLEQQMKASLADLETLEAGHIEELNQVKVEAEALQQKAAEEAELKHTERVRQLEHQLNTTEAELSKARSTHAKQLEDLDRRNDLDQASALAALKESHSSIVSDLQDQLRAAQEAIEKAETEHADRLKQSEAQLTSRHTEELDLLRASHAQELEKIESKAKLNGEQALEEARSRLLEENRQLEAQSKSLQGDLDVTRFQIQSLKGILRSMEEESKEKDQEHADSIEKLEQDLSMSVVKLAEQSSRMMHLQMTHDQALAEAKKAWESESQQNLESLRADHDKALAESRRNLENEHQQLTEKIQDEHAKSVQASQSSHQSQHDELRQQLKQDYDSQLDEVLKTLENQWKAQVDLLEDQNAAASARLAQTLKDHEEALQATRSEHDATIAKLQSQLQEARGAIEDTTQLEGVRSQLVEVQAQLGDISQKHAEAMSVIQDRESTLAVLKDELAATQTALEQRRDSAEVEELNSKYIAAQKALEESREKHAQAVRDIKAGYDAKLEKLLTELNVAKEAAEGAQVPSSDQTELEAVTARLGDAKKTIASLQADLDGAMLEVETQRNLAEESQKEVEQLKQVQKQAEVISLPSPKPRRKSRSPRRKSMNPLSPGPGASKLGLESSKWATEGDKDKDGVSSDAGKGGNDEANPAAEPIPTPTPDTPGRHPHSGTMGKRNVAGQLAGIQEQIKQLDDLSEDFLEDHQKMASMLNRVDDGTSTSTSTIQVEEDASEE